MKALSNIARQFSSAVGMQWVYVMGVWPKSVLSANWHWHGKVGITTSPGQRRADVERSVRLQNPNLNIYCLPLPVMASRAIEVAAHAFLRPLSSNPFPGSNGGTEWFRSLNILLSGAAFLVGFANGVEIKPLVEWCILLVVVPIPFDLTIIVVGLVAIHWGLIFLTCYGVAQFF